MKMLKCGEMARLVGLQQEIIMRDDLPLPVYFCLADHVPAGCAK